MLNPEGISEILLKEGSDEQLQFNAPLMMEVYAKADKILNILGDHNLKSLGSYSQRPHRTATAFRRTSDKALQ